MANPYRGEITLTFAQRVYTLRPTFHILCSLESRLGLPLPDLLRRVREKGLLASEILLILCVATRHDGSAPFAIGRAMELPAHDSSLKECLPDIARFLLLGLQGHSSLNIPVLLERCHRAFGITPCQFWQMTMAELRFLLPSYPTAGTEENAAETLAVLMNAFPDHPLQEAI